MERGTLALLSRRRFDVDEYHRMARAGILHEDDRVELIDGEIVRMSAIGSRHMSCVSRLHRAFVLGLRDRAFVSSQNPVRLDRHNEPEPDGALLRSRADDYAAEVPGPADTLLLVEVADSSLPFDRDVKLPLYARAGIPEVWIVDLTTDSVEVFREPSGGSFRTSSRLTGGTIAPAAFPDFEIDVREILPSRRE